MVFNATFNNLSVISWRSVSGENTDMLQVDDKLYHIKLYRVHLARSGIRIQYRLCKQHNPKYS